MKPTAKNTVATATILLLLGVVALLVWNGGLRRSTDSASIGTERERSNNDSVAPEMQAELDSQSEGAARRPTASGQLQTLDGRVIDAVTQEAIAGAALVLHVNQREVAAGGSAADGSFSLPATLEPDDLSAPARIAASAEGYASAFAGGWPGQPVTIRLERALDISGRVVTQAQPAAGVPGARVRCHTGEWAWAAGETVTDAHGAFRLATCARGPVNLVVTHESYARRVEALGERLLAEKVRVEIELVGGVMITGHVTSHDGKPAAADVIADDGIAGSGFFNAAAVSKSNAADGAFSLGPLAAGTWRIAAIDAHGRVAGLTRTLETSNVEVDLVLPEGARMRGRVTSSGSRVPGARVTLFRDFGDIGDREVFIPFRTALSMARGQGSYARIAVTDLRGSFELEGLEPGRYSLHASHQDHGAASLEVSAGQTDIIVELPASGLLIVRLVHAQGSPVVTEGHVSMAALDPDTGLALGARMGALADGKARARLNAGTYEVQVVLRSGLSPDAQAAEIRADAVTELVFTVPAGATIRGRVQDTGDRPIQGARVAVPISVWTVEAGAWRLPHQGGVSTDEGGRFELSGPRSGQLLIYHPDFQTRLVPYQATADDDKFMDLGNIKLTPGKGRQTFFTRPPEDTVQQR